MIDAGIIARHARSLLGVPYVHQGRSHAGIDCVGLLVLVCKLLGVGNRTADRRDYPPTGEGIELEQRLRRGGFTKCAAGAVPVAGQVVSFTAGRTARVQHVGIMVTDTRMLHVYQHVGKVVEHELGSWKKRLAGVWQWPQ